MMTVVAMVPIMGALALAIDFSLMSKQRQQTLNALDAAGMAVARRITDTKTETEAEKALVIQYAKDFFYENLDSVRPENADLYVTFPQDNFGGGTLKLDASLRYEPVFFPVFADLIGEQSEVMNFKAATEIRLKNTLEVALVLDNSTSMDLTGTGSGKKRLTLLKEAATQLVETLSAQALVMKQINKPVQFSVVPFAASVNVGPAHHDADWLDQDGLSPIHYENFTWAHPVRGSEDKKFKTENGRPHKDGAGWGPDNGKLVTRFDLFNALKRTSGSSTVAIGAWGGCVEARPAPYNTTDEPPSSAKPETLFVPMFAPDGAGNRWLRQPGQWPNNTIKTFNADNNWWDDADTEITSTDKNSQLSLQSRIGKYFSVAPSTFTLQDPFSGGPNHNCTTKPITPLTDVVADGGLDTILDAIDDMEAKGYTNVPEGMAWGWRTVSHGIPFTTGRPDTEQNNDKVVIVLTDGANTYSEASGSDHAKNRSSYAAFGFAGRKYDDPANPANTVTRLYLNTTVSKTTYTGDNFTAAMNQHFKALCDNAKDEGIIVITVSLDLSLSNATEKKQIDALHDCASESRFTKDLEKDPSGKTMKKLYYPATGGNLAEKFREITNELSNLRIAA